MTPAPKPLHEMIEEVREVVAYRIVDDVQVNIRLKNKMNKTKERALYADYVEAGHRAACDVLVPALREAVEMLQQSVDHFYAIKSPSSMEESLDQIRALLAKGAEK